MFKLLGKILIKSEILYGLELSTHKILKANSTVEKTGILHLNDVTNQMIKVNTTSNKTNRYYLPPYLQ